MSEERQDNGLHLPDLSITGFRGIASLTIKRLGRVTLIAGKNSVGKTSVLDAVRVYAARGKYDVLAELLESRQELAVAVNHEPNRQRRFLPDFAALFHGRNVSRNACISIGPNNGADQLRIEEAPDSKPISRGEQSFAEYFTQGYRQAFKVVFQCDEQLLPWFLPIEGSAAARTVERHSDGAFLFSWGQLDRANWQPQIGCQPLGPGVLSNEEIVRFWNAIALTDDEDRAIQALRVVFGTDLERVAVVREDEPTDKKHVERVLTKLRGQARPVPFQSLGDGALHLAGTALALANSRDGFLLIDESENGIHHTVQRKYWRMVLKTADENNVQVLATTHSYDCVRGFAQAINECEGVDGALVRLERKDEGLRAIEYSERNIRALAKQPVGIEVR